MTNELVRHFLIETSPKGVRLKGCPNEPYFGESVASLYSSASDVKLTKCLCVGRLSFRSGVPALDDSAGSALQADDPRQRSAAPSHPPQRHCNFLSRSSVCLRLTQTILPTRLYSDPSLTDPNEEALELVTPTDAVVELLKQGAGKRHCNSIHLFTCSQGHKLIQK